MNKTIELPEESEAPTLAQRLQGAVYSASMHHFVTPIVCGHRRAYIVPAWMYEEFIKGGAEAQVKP